MVGVCSERAPPSPLAPHTRSTHPLHPQVQRCTLLSIKTGGCPETCGYCSQSSSWSKETGTKAEKLMDLEDVYQVGVGCVGGTVCGRQAGRAPGARAARAPTRPPAHTPHAPAAQAALRAKDSGSTRFCMGAAWRGPSQVGKGQWQRVLEMVK